MKCLVTGGAGFIGTHLCHALAACGHDVTSIDVRFPRTRVPNVKYLEGDILNPDALAEAVKNQNAIFHLAAFVSVPYCQQYPLLSYEVNCLGTLRVMEASLRTGNRPHFIFSSSSAVYVDPPILPCHEGMALPEPISFYGAQKAASETLIRLFAKQHQLPATVFRFFNVYGPGQDPSSPYSGVITLFLKALSEGKPLDLNGGGNQTRDFISVHDVVRGLSLSLQLDPSTCVGQPINLASGTETSVSKLAQILSMLSGKELKSRTTPGRPGDVLRSVGSNTRARQILGWEPTLSLEKGLQEFFLGNVFQFNTCDGSIPRRPLGEIEMDDPLIP